MIHFLADESFPDPTAELIKSWGFAVTKVRELGLSGAKDPVIFQKAQEKNLILLTADKGFGDIRVYPPSLYAGVILLRIDPQDIAEKMRRAHAVLKKLLDETKEEEFRKTLFVVDRNKYRKRKMP